MIQQKRRISVSEKPQVSAQVCIALTALTVAAAALSAQLCVVYKTVFCAHICILCRKLYFVHTVIFKTHMAVFHTKNNRIVCKTQYFVHTTVLFTYNCILITVFFALSYILFNITAQQYFWNKSPFQANNTVISFVHSIFWRRKIYLVIYNCI